MAAPRFDRRVGRTDARSLPVARVARIPTDRLDRGRRGTGDCDTGWHRRGDGTNVPERQEIPALFEAAHPALARRFVAQLNASNAAFGTFRAEVAAWIAGATR